MIYHGVLLAAIVTAGLCAGAGPATFDVASVKISQAPDAIVFVSGGMMDSRSGKYRVPSVGGNVNIANWTLGGCIAAAWDLGPGQMSGPAWLNSDRYDIAARTSPQATQADLRIMLQALLAERFRLVAHREMKELPVYALVQAKNGPKLHASNGDQHLPVIFAPPARLIGQGSTMQGLALALGRPAGRTVVDKTGIDGTFDFSFSYALDDDAGPSIFTALQEQLGLRLEPQKAQREILVVDHAEKIPTAN